MNRNDRLNAFTRELIVLRPHLGHVFARSVAMVSESTLGTDYDPAKAALEYHLRRESGEPRPTRPKKRPS
jgi:hypothetical protein